jgi:transposase
MNYYIGMDSHSKTTTAVVVDEKGKIIERQKFATTEANLLNFVRKYKGKKHLTFEEMHLAQWLYIILKKEVDHLIVCNPVFVSKRPGAKDDFRDALHMAQELRGGHLVPVYHDESHWIQLRTLVYGYLGLVEEIVRTKNRLKAVFRSEAIDTSQSDFYEVAREKCKDLSHESAKFVAENLFWQIEGLEKRKREYTERLKLNSKKYKPIKNLMTVPGISIIRASIITAIVCTPHRFKNKHQFWAYCMLARHFQISDGIIYGNKKIHGRADLKQVFLGAAESAMRSDTSLRDHYEEVRKKGIDYEEAKRALARKIAALCLALLKNNGIYQDDYEKQQEERSQLRKQLNKRV